MTAIDPRRRFSAADRRRIYENQQRRCFVAPIGCGQRVRFDDEFHCHHVHPHALGGATVIGNAVGLCGTCHRKVDHAALSAPSRPEPRDWQTLALPDALTKLRATRRYTAAAAPGAGKTLFAGFVADELLAAGDVERIVVFVPTENLTRQWADELALNFGIYIDPSVVAQPDRQRHGTIGSAATYASLSKDYAIRAHAALAAESRTLFIFDEVHHCADKGSWGIAVRRIVEHASDAMFMNLSGTMFRSNRNEQIATVAYEPWDERTLKAVADVEIHAAELIEKGVLRQLHLYEFDSDVRWVDLTTGETATGSLGAPPALAGEGGEVGDGIALPVRQMLAAVHADQAWLTAFFIRWLDHLEAQRVSLGGHPLKGLVVARDQAHAQLYADMLDELVLSHLTTPVWVAKSEDGPAARDALENARKSRSAGILVSISMASEGYDNPDISSIAYLSNVSAPLRLAQIAGRAMRPTPPEKAGMPLAGTVWLPKVTELIDIWRNVLINDLHVIELDPETCARCGHNPCACKREPGPRICSVCGNPKPCLCLPMPEELPDVELSDPTLAGLAVNGEDVPIGAYESLEARLRARGGMSAIPHIPTILRGLYDAADGDARQVLRWIEGTDR